MTDYTLDDLDIGSVIQEPEPEGPRKRLLHADELNQLPPPTWMFDREIPNNVLAVLYGISGSGKSFIALDYAKRRAQTHNVIYVAAEGASGYAARNNAWNLHYKKGSGALYFWPHPVNLMNSQEVQEFIDAISGIDHPFVVIDTLARCMVGGDENSAKDMGIAIDACDKIRRATGETLMVVHHTGKNGTNERGSSALRGAADVMIELTNDDGLITVSCSKMKDAPPFEARRLRLIPVGDSCVPMPAMQVLQTKDAPLTDQQRIVLEVLDLAIFEDAGARSRDLESAISFHRSVLFRTLSTLKRLGYVSQGAKGDPYYITETGRTKLQQKHASRLNEPPHQNGQVSQSQASLNVVAETSSLKSQQSHPPLRGETRETTSLSETETDTPPGGPIKLTSAWRYRRNGHDGGTP